jgi:hypothetical protein
LHTFIRHPFEAPLFRYIKSKIDFQKAIISAFGEIGEESSIDVLFDILNRGSSRFWNNALTSLLKFNRHSVTDRILEIYEHSPRIWTQVAPHRDILLKSELIPFLTGARPQRLTVLKDLLITQGLKNRSILELIYEFTTDSQLKQTLHEIMYEISSSIPLTSGFSLLI